jgi:outer membrane murein-binding lipoprotein Lpp
MVGVSTMRLYRNLLGGVALGALVLGSAGVHAQSKIDQLQGQIQQIQQNYQSQIQNLQSQVDQLKEQQRQQAEQAEVVRNQAAQAAAEVKAASSGLPGTYHVGGVTLKVGGFIESATIFRSSNETSDVGSILGSNGANGGIPLSGVTSSANNKGLDEFRESARQSRLSLLATGQPDSVTTLTAYWENDWLGQGGTANSNESNSYNLRMRHAFAMYDRSDWGFTLLGGQTWSLATLDSSGLDPFKVVTPLSIDAQYNVGFNWMRQPQIRFTEHFAPGWWAAVSFENPQLTTAGGLYGGIPGETLNVKDAAPGGSLLNASGTSFSFDGMPDIIGKVVAEPGWGHFELYGLARQFRDQATPTATGPLFLTSSTNNAFGGGIGFGAVLPVVPKLIDVTVSGLWGRGIGKYASAQLPDVAFDAAGKPKPIPEIEAMVGVIGHPLPTVDLYGYWGIEHESSESFTGPGGVPLGYGNSAYSNVGCSYGNLSYNVAGKPSCNVDTVSEAQIGGWWNFYKGAYGRMALGVSYAYVDVGTFSGIGGSPSGHDNIVMTSFRYYPF